MIRLVAVGLGIVPSAFSDFASDRELRCSIVLQSTDFDAVLAPVNTTENGRPVWQMQSPNGSLESQYLSFTKELRRWRVGPQTNFTSYKAGSDGSDKFYVSDTWFNGYWNCFQETIDVLSPTGDVAGRLYALRQNPNKDKVLQCRPPQVEHQIIHTTVDGGGERMDIKVGGNIPWFQAACVSGAVAQYPNAVAVQYYNENVEKRGNVLRNCKAILPGASKPTLIPTADKGYTSCVLTADEILPVHPSVTPPVTPQEDKKAPEDRNATTNEVKCCKQKKCWKLRKGTKEKLEEVPVNA